MAKSLAHNLNAGERTEDVCLKTESPFCAMLLRRELQDGLSSAGFVYPTKLQGSAIPLGKAGIDLIVHSKSGTGKTLVFSVIILQAYNSNIYEPQSLIVVPTREIAVQTETVLNKIGGQLPNFRCACVIGGMNVYEDRQRLKGAKAIVGTPGRLIHLIQNNFLNTSQITLLVLDEVDKIYSKSFCKSFQKIRNSIPSTYQTIACSATFNNNLDKKLPQIMRNPLLISTANRSSTLLGIKQFVYQLPQQAVSILEMENKLNAVRSIFDCICFKQCLLFAGSQSRASSYSNLLEKEGWPCKYISGSLSQEARLEIYNEFRDFKIRVLISTDLLARGVDFDNVNLVINLEIPQDIETYLHRIGRAGRFGSEGIAITFLSSLNESNDFTQIISKVGGGMKVLEYPQNKDPLYGRDFWDFSNFEEDCKYYGMFGEKNESPLNEVSLLGKHDDSIKIKSNEDISNSSISIDTATYCIDLKDSAVNMLDLCIESKTKECRPSDSQLLPSSNTIDDASSIADDSSKSNKNDVRNSFSEYDAIKQLLKILVDSSNQTNFSNAKKLDSTRCKILNTILVDKRDPSSGDVMKYDKNIVNEQVDKEIISSIQIEEIIMLTNSVQSIETSTTSIEVQHFPSPTFTDDKSSQQLINDNQNQNLSVIVMEQFEIRPQDGHSTNSESLNVNSPSSVRDEPSNNEEITSDVTYGPYVTSGFVENTTTMDSSGIETSEAELGYADESYQTSLENLDSDLEGIYYDQEIEAAETVTEFKEDEMKNKEISIEDKDEEIESGDSEYDKEGEVDDDDTDDCDTEYDDTGDVTGIDDSDNDSNGDDNEPDFNRDVPHGLYNILQLQGNSNNGNHSTYQSAYTKWMEMYWNQIYLIQDYVKFASYVQEYNKKNSDN